MALSLTRTAQPSTSNADANLNNNWTAIENLVNGNLDTTNLKTSTAAITAAQLETSVATRLNPASPTTNFVPVWNGSAWVAQKITTTQIDAAAGIVGTQLAAATVADSNLASPVGSVYRTIQQVGEFQDGSVSGPATFIFCQNEKPQQSGTTGIRTPMLFYLDPADYAVAGKTSQLRVRAQLYVNGTAPVCTYTIGLFPVASVGGAAGVLQVTLGTITSGSSVVVTNPAIDSLNQGNSGDFTMPSAGYFALGFSTSVVATAANNATAIMAQLQYRAT